MEFKKNTECRRHDRSIIALPFAIPFRSATMGHTYTKLTSHVIFSTKDRTPILTSDRRADIHDYLRGILRGIQCDVLGLNGVSDHVHIAFRFPPSLSVSFIVQTAKANSSKWINDNRLFRCHFSWQR